MNPRVQVIMKVTSQMAGEAEFTRAPYFMMTKSKIFTNPRFCNYAPGTYLVCNFKLSKIRLLGSITPVPADRDWKTMELAGWDGTGEPANSEVVEATEAEVKPSRPHIKSSSGFVGNVFVEGRIATVFNAALTLAKTSPVNVLMVGPSGFGKTSIPEAIASANDLSFFRMNCGSVRDPEEWFGTREAIDGSTHFVPSDFIKHVEAGNAIIVLDEFNRIEPWLHNTLYPLLDHARRTRMHGKDFICGPNLIFVATINDGHQYTGTFVLDTAIMNRMDMIVEVGALPANAEINVICNSFPSVTNDEATTIVAFVNKLRSIAKTSELPVDFSTRSSLKIARLISVGVAMADAVKAVMVSGQDPSVAKIVMDAFSS